MENLRLRPYDSSHAASMKPAADRLPAESSCPFCRPGADMPVKGSFAPPEAVAQRCGTRNDAERCSYFFEMMPENKNSRPRDVQLRFGTFAVAHCGFWFDQNPRTFEFVRQVGSRQELQLPIPTFTHCARLKWTVPVARTQCTSPKLLIFLAAATDHVPFCSRPFHPIRCDFVAAISGRTVSRRLSPRDPPAALARIDLAPFPNGSFAPIVLKKSFFAMAENSQDRWCVLLAAM